MSLSRDQQVTFRRQVGMAWAARCRNKGTDAKDKLAQDEWYRGVLSRELGVISTLGMDARSQFAEACAAFEAIHGQSYYWSLRALGKTDAEQQRRALHAIRKVAAEIGDSSDADAATMEDYIAGIARAALKLDHRPDIERLDAPQLSRVLRIVRAQRDVIADRVGARAEEVPF